jgi:hypothetical protein
LLSEASCRRTAFVRVASSEEVAGRAGARLLCGVVERLVRVCAVAAGAAESRSMRAVVAAIRDFTENPP